MVKGMKVQFGCGEFRPEGWHNFDREVDVRRPLPFEDGAVEFILAEHVVEHVSHAEAIGFFRECRRILKPGGVLRVAVPGVERAALCCDDAVLAEQVAQGWMAEATARAMVIRVATATGHQSAWTERLLSVLMWGAGFDTERCEPVRSRIPEFDWMTGCRMRPGGDRLDWFETVVVEGTKA